MSYGLLFGCMMLSRGYEGLCRCQGQWTRKLHCADHSVNLCPCCALTCRDDVHTAQEDLHAHGEQSWERQGRCCYDVVLGQVREGRACMTVLMKQAATLRLMGSSVDAHVRVTPFPSMLQAHALWRAWSSWCGRGRLYPCESTHPQCCCLCQPPGSGEPGPSALQQPLPLCMLGKPGTATMQALWQTGKTRGPKISPPSRFGPHALMCPCPGCSASFPALADSCRSTWSTCCLTMTSMSPTCP